MAVKEISKIVFGERSGLVFNDCKNLVQHPLLIKEPNVNDQDFIS